MAIKEGITEIPDSEDELMTSSPTVIEHQVDNPTPTPCHAFHTSKEAQRGARSQQASIEHVPASVSNRDEHLATEQGPHSPAIDMANPQHDNPPAQQPVNNEAKVIHAEPLQEQEMPLRSNINEQRHDTDSSDEHPEQSTHHEPDEGVCAEDERSLESSSPQIEPTARVWGEDRGAVKEMQSSEAIGDKVVISGPPQSAELQGASSSEPNTKNSAETTRSFEKGEASRNESSEFADTDMTRQETIDPGRFAKPNLPEAGLTEPVAKVNVERIEESGPMLGQQQQQAGQQPSHATENLTIFTGSMQQQREERREGVPECQTLSHLKHSAHGNPDLTNAMDVVMDVSAERSHSTQPRSADIDLGASSMKQIHCQGRIKDDATSRLDLKHETEESGGDLNKLEAFARGYLVDQPDRMNIDAIFPTTEQSSLPEASAEGAAVQKPAVVSSTNLPKERDDLKLQIDDQSSQKHLQQQLQLSPRTKATPIQKKMSPARGSQEAIIADLRAQKATLVASLAVLPIVQELIAENENEDNNDNALSRDSEDEPIYASIMTAANKIVKTHIKLLHEYNEMKDVGQGLMGLIADSRGVRIVEVQDEFGIESKD